MSKALILAAGKSTRIAPIFNKLPKPLLKINGKSILVHNLMLLSRHNIHEIWINIHYCSDLIRDEIGNGEQWGVRVHYSSENDILGTAGAVKHLENHFSDACFFVLYGDNLNNCDLTELFQQQEKSNHIGTIAVYDPTETLNSGITGGKLKIKEDGTVESFVEGTMDTAGLNFVNAGVYLLSPEILKYIPMGFSDFGKDIFPSILRKDIKLSTYKMKKGYCFGVDTEETYLRTQKLAVQIADHD